MSSSSDPGSRHACPQCGRVGLDTLPSGDFLCVRCGVVSERQPQGSPPPSWMPAIAHASAQLSTLPLPLSGHRAPPPTATARPDLTLLERPHERPKLELQSLYRCQNCPIGCDFVETFRDELAKAYAEHPGQRVTAQLIASALGYTERHLHRLRTRHGFGRWPPPKSFWAPAARSATTVH